MTYLNVLNSSFQKAIALDFKSNDISDLLKTHYNTFVKSLPHPFLQKVFNKPYSYLTKYRPDILRSFVKKKNYKYPQGVAIVIRGLVNLINKNIDAVENKRTAIELGEWLIDNRSTLSKHFSWGQPFKWYSRIVFPPNLPRATVSSQVAWAMLDLYQLTSDEKYLAVAKDVSYLFKEEFNYTEDINGNICISYTTLDNFHVHNASMLAASVVSRVALLTDDVDLKNFAKKAVEFTIYHQNKDGSFYYWAPPDKLIDKIDNFHTGFVLESLRTIMDDFNDDRYKHAYRIGMEFYLERLFDGPIPRYDYKKVYPIDIQSCAQSIISFAMDDLDSKYIKKAREVADYTISNMFIPNKNHFGYRIHKNGFFDKNYYFRWGDAWMIRALSYLV